MKNRKALLLLFALVIFCPSFGQTFVLQETNIKKNTAQCVNAAKKCELVLLRKQTLYTLSFSNKSSLTNHVVNDLSEKFIKFFPKESLAQGDGPVIERGFESQRDPVVKLTYGFIPPNKKATTDYVQVIVAFDNGGNSPKINDILVKNKVDLGIITLTDREMLKFKPAPTKPTTKPASKKKG